MEQWKRLLDELRDEFILREEELQLLHNIDLELLKSARPLNTTFDFIVNRTQDLLKADRTIILLRRGRRLENAYSTNQSDLGQHIDLNRSLTGQSLLAARTLNVGDVRMPPYSTKYVPIQHYQGPPLRSLIATPIRVQQIMVGVLNSESTRVDAFSEMHEQVFAGIASQVAIALQHAQLFDQNRLFSEVDELIFAAGDSQQVIQTALQKVMDALHVLEHIELSGAQIFFRRGKHELEVVHSTDPSHIGLSINVEQSICGRALREGKTVLIGDVSTEPEYRSMLGPSIQSEIAIPILLGDAAVSIGVLNVESTEPDAFEGFAQVLLENFADKVRTLLAFAKLRSDVTETMELRNASDLLVAVGDQASNMIHRMNNTVGAMRLRIIELQDLQDAGDIAANEFLTETLAALRDLADQTLEMPEEVTRLLNQQGATVNVSDVVKAVVDKRRLPATITTRLDLDPTVPPLSLYSFDIVVENLVQNAIDAMPGGGTLSITTTTMLPTSVPTGYVELAISDTGGGIPPEVLPKIFELNFTTKTKKGRGHGLGLWWIRNFVLRSKGDIAVNSSVGHGTEFVVKIPFEREPVSQPAE